MLQFLFYPVLYCLVIHPRFLFCPFLVQYVLFQTHLVMAPRRTRQYLCYLKLVDTNEVCYFFLCIEIDLPLFRSAQVAL